ncbi:MAG: ABC transporter ATP-binding protein, partial [Limisphaerales bacterium]
TLPEVNPPGTKRLDVTCEHVTKALQILHRLKGVRTSTVFGQSMRLLVDESLPDDLIRTELARANITHVDIRQISPSLEDVFVALTANRDRELQEAAA